MGASRSSLRRQLVFVGMPTVDNATAMLVASEGWVMSEAHETWRIW